MKSTKKYVAIKITLKDVNKFKYFLSKGRLCLDVQEYRSII